MLRPIQVTPPTTPVVALLDAKRHLRVDYSDDDILIQGMIDAATAQYDGYMGTLGRAISPQDWAQSYSDFSATPWRIPLGDLITFAWIKYYDINNAQQTLDPAIYSVLQDEVGPYISLNRGKAWPAVYARDDAVKIQWTCGFATTPNDIKLAIKILVAHWYENRGLIVTEKRLETIPMAADAIMRKYSRGLV